MTVTFPQSSRVEMGEHLPPKPVQHRITNSTQFMLPFYMACLQYYGPDELASTAMDRDSLRTSLAFALRDCPFVFSRLVIRDDKSVWLEYDPRDPNNPVIEFQDSEVTYGELEGAGFPPTVTEKYGLGLPPLESKIARAADQPLLLFKVSYLRNGGVVLYSTRNHTLFDGKSIFYFIAHWAKCNRALANAAADIPPEIQPMAMAFVSNTDELPDVAPKELALGKGSFLEDPYITRNAVYSRIYSLPVSTVQRMKQDVMDSDYIGQGEWVSSNNVVAAFIAQHIFQANCGAGNPLPDEWAVFMTSDIRQILGLPLHGIGAPLFQVQHRTLDRDLIDSSRLPILAKHLRQGVASHTRDYLQKTMNWIDAEYKRMSEQGNTEPWRYINFETLAPSTRYIGVSCMNKMPIYDADFGSGRPRAARSMAADPDYIIVFPGPPVDGSLEYDSLHIHIVLTQAAMDALENDPEWNRVCTPVNATSCF